MRKIIHCDADCFFAAIEMRDDPSLRGIPIAVGGKVAARGVISTCNYEARRFGVHSAMPAVTALRLCPNLILLPHRMEAYREASMQMRHIFYEYTDLVEPLSLDEAFLDVSEAQVWGGSATRIAQDIRNRIKREVGISVSAGVAPNKFIAKVASDWNKPDGLCVVPPARVSEFVAHLPVKKLFGVGTAMAARLSDLGVLRCADLHRFTIFELQQRFGQMGVRLYELSRGIDERQVVAGRRRKSLSVEHTFAQDLPNVNYCLARLPDLMGELSRRLAQIDEGYKVIKLFVKVKFANFITTTVERQAAELTVVHLQELCVEASERLNLPIRLLGIGVRFVDLHEDKAFVQLDLFN
jgi:DNA polymerase IV